MNVFLLASHLMISLTAFGVHLGAPVGDPRVFVELCNKIEEWRFDSVWLADGLTRAVPEPFPLLACAAAATTRMKLGTCIYVIPIRHPLITAKLSTTLDRLSQGRHILGVGVGWREDEFIATGVPFSKRGRITDECLEIIRQAWTDGSINFQGQFFKISGVKMDLQPEQKPHPPIWVGGNGMAAALRAARFGEVWIPTDYSVEEYKEATTLLKKACEKTNRDPNTLKLASHLLVILDQSKSVAEELAKKVADSLHESVEDLKKWALVGDPKEVAQRLDEYKAAGVNYHVLNFATKVRDEKRIELFARELVPSLT